MRLGWCALLSTLILPAAAEAQLAPLGIPRGMFRFEIDGSFAYANERFNDGTKENLGANFTSPGLGSDRIPTLSAADQRIASLIGQPGYKLDLGASIGTAQVSTGTGAFTLGDRPDQGAVDLRPLPIVSSWWRQTVALDTTTSNAGVNAADPAFGNTAGAATAEAFFSQFNVSLAELQQRLTSGIYDGDPAAKALAIETLASGQALSDSLGALIVNAGTASPFLPLSTSSAGQAPERPGNVACSRPSPALVSPASVDSAPAARPTRRQAATWRRTGRPSPARSATRPSATASAPASATSKSVRSTPSSTTGMPMPRAEHGSPRVVTVRLPTGDGGPSRPIRSACRSVQARPRSAWASHSILAAEPSAPASAGPTCCRCRVTSAAGSEVHSRPCCHAAPPPT